MKQNVQIYKCSSKHFICKTPQTCGPKWNAAITQRSYTGVSPDKTPQIVFLFLSDRVVNDVSCKCRGCINRQGSPCECRHSNVQTFTHKGRGVPQQGMSSHTNELPVSSSAFRPCHLHCSR